MKKIISVLIGVILVLSSILAASPISGKDEKKPYEAALSDNPVTTDVVLAYGSVSIDTDLVIEMEILTNTPDRTFYARMEIGGALPSGRIIVPLGEIITDGEGKGVSYFDLKNYDKQVPTPRVIGPHFVISSWLNGPVEFDTSLLVFPYSLPSPRAFGRIVLINQTTPPVFDTSFRFIMSYGDIIAYPVGVQMTDDMTIDSGFVIPPGTYTICDLVPAGWYISDIDIIDPSGGSISKGIFATINLAPGETVTVTYCNNQIPSQ